MRCTVLCLVAFFVAATSAGDTPVDLSLEQCESRYCGGELRWDLKMFTYHTTFDSLWLESSLINSSDRIFAFEPHDHGPYPKLMLMFSGHSPLIRPMMETLRPERFSYNRRPKPGDVFYGFRVDLRAYFGKLNPGKYGIQVIWPEDGYSINGLPGHESVKLESAVFKFEVQAASIDDFRLSRVPGPADPTPHMLQRMQRMQKRTAIVRDEKPGTAAEGHRPIGTLTNKFDKPLWFLCRGQYDHNKDVTKPPLQVRLRPHRFSRQWGSAAGWAPGMAHWGSGGHKRYYGLEPGESIKIFLPDWVIDGDGAYFYGLDDAYIGDVDPDRWKQHEKGVESRGRPDPFVPPGEVGPRRVDPRILPAGTRAPLGTQLFSEPFVVDRVEAPAAPAAVAE